MWTKDEQCQITSKGPITQSIHYRKRTPKVRKRNTENTKMKARNRIFWKSSTNDYVAETANFHKRTRKVYLNDVNLAVYMCMTFGCKGQGQNKIQGYRETLQY